MIPFSPPRIDKEIIDEINQALLSGWITTGPRTKLFEQKLSEYTGAPKTLCLNSATAGLELILRWFGVTEGDEVIVPAYTYAASANVIIHCGAKPVFIDSSNDFNLNAENIARLITEKTKVIIPVDIAGWPCDYDNIFQIVNSKEIKQHFKPCNSIQEQLGRILILSDAAHSLGAVYKGKRTGTLADVTVFSFHAVKNLTTAEGGAICLCLPPPFSNDDIYNCLCIKLLHGQNKDALAKTRLGNWRYDIIEAGYKCNMTDLQAAIGLVEIKRYENDMLVKRKYIFEKYTELLTPYHWAELPVFSNPERKSSFHVFALRIKNFTEKMRDAMIERIFQQDVAVNVHFIPLPMMSFYKSLGYKMEDFPVAYDNYSREISLPVYYDLTDEQISMVIQAVVNAYNKVKNF